MIFGKSTPFHIYNVQKFEHVDEKYNLVKQGLLLWQRRGHSHSRLLICCKTNTQWMSIGWVNWPITAQTLPAAVGWLPLRVRSLALWRWDSI